VNCAKTAESIEMPFAMWSQVDPRKHVLDGGSRWGNLVNTTEPSMFGSTAKTAEPIEMLFAVWTRV